MTKKLQKADQVINRFHFNAIRSAAYKLTTEQLAAKFGFSRPRFSKLQKTSIFVPLKVKPETLIKVLEVAEEYNITFLEKYAVAITSNKRNNRGAILTGFQYRLAIMVLYDIQYRIQQSGITLLDSYFRKVDNNERLEDKVTVLDNIKRVKKLFESKGVYFPDYNTVQLDVNFNQKVEVKEINQALDVGIQSFLEELDTNDILLLSYIKDARNKNSSSKLLEIDFADLSNKINISTAFLKQKVSNLHRLGIITKYSSVNYDSKDNLQSCTMIDPTSTKLDRISEIFMSIGGNCMKLK